jgi:hypothetical protein
MSCPFYGKSAVALLSDSLFEVERGPLIDTHGNQCALIIHKHAPCMMETQGVEVDGDRCPLIVGSRALTDFIDLHLPRADAPPPHDDTHESDSALYCLTCETNGRCGLCLQPFKKQ